MISVIREWGIQPRRSAYLAGLLGFAVAVSVGGLGCEQLGLGYVGTDTCLICHNGQEAADKREFLGSPHAANGCESCHGPGFFHVRNGGRYGLFVGGGEAAMTACNRCHPQEVAGFKQSAHATKNILVCTECHDPHAKQETPRPFVDNQLCLQCHAYQGFDTEAAIEAHTFHKYDPTGTGQSRCVLCHMVPAQRANQEHGAHNHSLMPVPPIRSNQAGITPAPPNSCAGITGCHDGSVRTAPVFNVDDPQVNEQLQILYDSRYGS